MKKIIIAAVLCLPLADHAAEVDAAAKTAAYQSSVSQEALRRSSQRLKQEMLTLLNEYSGFGAASKELAQLKSTIESLDQLSEQDMARVAQALAAASRDDSTTGIRDQIVMASNEQKEIQSTLIGLADSLTLQADQANLLKRLEELAFRQSQNRRGTLRLISLTTVAGNLSETEQRNAIEDHSRFKAEQNALETEIGLAMENLLLLTQSAKTDPDAAQHVNKALDTARSAKLEQRIHAAATSLEKALPDSAAHQQIILQTLKSMANSLARSRTLEDQTRELAADLDELARKEATLADKASQLNDRNNDEASEAQQEIADRLDLIKERIDELGDQASQKSDEVTDRAEKIADKVAEDEFVKDSKNRDATEEAQKDLAEKLGDIAENLQQKADQLAEQNNPTDSSIAMSDEEKAIQEAMENLLEAKANNEAAGKQNDKKQDYSENLEQAREQLAKAGQNASMAGQEASEATQQAKDALEQAESHAALAADKKQPGHNLYHVNANIDKALASLQQAANQLASVQQSQASQNPESGDQNSGQMMEGEGTGGIGEAKGPPAKRFTAGSASSDAQRDALNLLKTEKTAPDYSPMVNQYIKNLANEQ